MTKTFVIVVAALTAVLMILLVNQARLAQRVDKALAGMSASRSQAQGNSASAESGNQDKNLQRQLELIEQKLAETSQRLDALENRASSPAPRASLRPIRPLRPNTAVPILDQPLGGRLRRPWGPEQVIGPPDTLEAGDRSTAWAAREPDAGAEWLQVGYEKEVEIAEVRVRETYNPGALILIAAVLADGSETLIWKGVEPRDEAPVDRSFEVSQKNLRAKSIKIYLDTAKVPGWNEIDAVELVGTDGSRQWATQAWASSTYADLASTVLR